MAARSVIQLRVIIIITLLLGFNKHKYTHDTIQILSTAKFYKDDYDAFGDSFPKSNSFKIIKDIKETQR